jgi:uncharacterized protein (TIGR00304 family)
VLEGQEVGLFLVFLGVIIVLIGMLYIAFSSGGRVEGGGVVIIGPIPIVFGSNKKIAWGMLIVALILTFLLYILYFYAYRRMAGSAF